MPISEPHRIAIIGLGLIGGSIALRLASRNAEFSISAYDTDSHTRDLARRHSIEVEESMSSAIGGAELVLVAVPPNVTAQTVVSAVRTNTSAFVADLASVKAPVLDEVRSALSERELQRYLPAHPLAGAASSGFESAHPSLLDESTWAICPSAEAQGLDCVVSLGSLVEVFDARLIPCRVEQHDLSVARTSHAPHLLAEVIAASLDGTAPALAASLSGGGFRDLTRIAGADYALWSEILESNWDEVREVVAEWAAELQSWADRETLEQPKLQELWKKGTSRVQLLERVRWSQVSWRDASCAANWPALLEIGQAGLGIRRPRLRGGELHFEQTAYKGSSAAS